MCPSALPAPPPDTSRGFAPQPPGEQHIFLEIVSTDSLPSSHRSFQNTSYFTLVSTQIAVGLGHPVHKQACNGGFPLHLPNISISLLMPNLQKLRR